MATLKQYSQAASQRGAAYHEFNAQFSAWKIVPPPGGIDIGAFVAVALYDKPAGPAYCLKAPATVTMPTHKGALEPVRFCPLPLPLSRMHFLSSISAPE